MPFVTPPRRRRDGLFDWAWESVPHLEELVSGDALFVEEARPDGCLMFLLIDVMGHGATAAYVVDLFRIRYLWDEDVLGQQPGELLFNLSSLIAHHYNDCGDYDGDGVGGLTDLGRKAAKERHTCAMAVLVDPVTGRVVLAGAQQPDPYRFVANDVAWRPLPVNSYIALGWPVEVKPDDDPLLFTESAIDLQPGDRLIAMTDGITQAYPTGGESESGLGSFFILNGLDRVLADLAEHHVPATQVGRLFSAVKSYVGPKWPDDDTTVVVWHRADPVVPGESEEIQERTENVSALPSSPNS